MQVCDRVNMQVGGTIEHGIIININYLYHIILLLIILKYIQVIL